MPYVRIETPDECPYHDGDKGICKQSGIDCWSWFPHGCPLDIVDDSEIEE